MQAPHPILRVPAAIGWQIWRRNRPGILTLVAAVGVTAAFNLLLERTGRWAGFAEALGYTVLPLALVATLGFFHFTEGQRMGGFGSFPHRLFTLPVSTAWLVAWPMLFGAIAVVTVYLAASRLIFAPLGQSLPTLWPCLYLVSACTVFQTILWCLASRRFLKLFCLSLAAAGLLLGWMFFIPSVIEGTLADWGFQGSPAAFLHRVGIGLALSGPAAYAVSVRQICRQRHGGETRRTMALGEWLIDRLPVRRRPFRSLTQAFFWHEWRQTGFILPACTAVVLALTFVPGCLAGPLSAGATTGILTWALVAPVGLAVIIGRGFGKPDFWSPDLAPSPFHAVRPLRSGDWVLVKIRVALVSVLITWAGVWLGLFVWASHAADFAGLDELWRLFKLHYPASVRPFLAVLSIYALGVVTLRFLMSGLPTGLSGRKSWVYGANTLVALGLASVPVLLVWQGDRADPPLPLHVLWPLIAVSPVALALLVVLKVVLGMWAWHRVWSRGLLPAHAVLLSLAAWTLATLPLIAWTSLAVPHTDWLRHVFLLAAMLVVPLAGPPAAMIALDRNRSR